MQVAELLREWLTNLAQVAFASPLSVPLWASVCWMLLLFVRKSVFRFICTLLGIEDEASWRQVFQRIDLSLQLLLALLAVLPFLHLIPGSAGNLLEGICRFAAPLLFFHALIQASDLIIFRWYLNRRRTTEVPAVFRSTVLAILYGIALLLLLDWIGGVNILPLIATSTVAAAVVGLALQDTLKNLFAGLTITVEDSLHQGDWVRFRMNDDTDRSFGEIVEIGWRSTKICTVNKNMAVIPNTQLTSAELINYSQPSPLQAHTVEFPVSLFADAAEVKSCLTSAAASVHGVQQDSPPAAMPVAVKTDHVIYRLRFWVWGFERQEAIMGEVIEAGWQGLARLKALPGADSTPPATGVEGDGDNIGSE